MRLSDFKGEEAIDVLADIIEPLTSIINDSEIKKMAKQEKRPAAVKFLKPMLKNHKSELIEVLAILNRKPVEEFKDEMTLVNLPVMVLDLINDPEVQKLFRSQGQKTVTPLASSGSATENTEAGEN